MASESSETAYRCAHCRHDLSGLPVTSDPDADPETEVVCPECGGLTVLYFAVERATPSRGWVYFLLWWGLLLGALGCVGGVVWLVLIA